LQGIADGVNAHGVKHGTKIDLWDVVALNAAEEWEYYVKEYDRLHGIKPRLRSAFPSIAARLLPPAAIRKTARL
jgi:hypothetical protein